MSGRQEVCVCGEAFAPKYRTHRFCSRICSNASRQWDDEKVSELRRLWPVRSAPVIGRILGVTPSSVIGKANRLGLPPKGPSIKAWREMQQELRA